MIDRPDYSDDVAYDCCAHILAQRKRFAERGGFREKLTAVRVGTRAAAEGAPECPECGKPMKRRTAKAGRNAGRDFRGCTGYPECQGVRKLEKEAT